MKATSQIIDDLGGYAALAEFLGLPVTTVSSWKSRGSIPVQHWTALIQLAKRRGVNGVSYKQLAKMRAAKVAS